MKDTYTRRAKVVRVIDGDTIEVDLDLGWAIYTRVSVRLAGLNAREIRDAGGKEARDHLAQLLPVGADITLQSLAKDKYGRALAVVTGPRGNVNKSLLEEGWAAPYDGGGKTSDHVPTWPRP